MRPYLNNPEIMRKISLAQANPNLLPIVLGDPQMMEFLGLITSSSCSNAATHDNKTLELLISTLKCSLEEAREEFEKETFYLRKEISDQKEELDKLRAWGTVNITWKISTFDSSSYSSTFNVAQYTFRMGLLVTGRRYGYLGFSINHVKRFGYDWVPIQMDGSSICLVGNGKVSEKGYCFKNAFFGKPGQDYGWKDFVAREDLKKFVENGKLTLKAEIRVRRSTIANLNLK
jgi:hypothetical protein